MIFLTFISASLLFSLVSAEHPSSCEDKSETCPDRAAAGECYKADSWEQIFEECPLSCNQCVCGDNHESCGVWAEYDQCTDNPDWMHKQCRKSCEVCDSCEDKDPECPELAAAGQCYEHEDWDEIFQKCPKSCHRCECGDNHVDCAEFAARGDCDASNGWMLVQCQKSCQVRICSESSCS
ncbi:hypothetical protein ACHWQZ_G003916 [Mnemiopsis leidyi]